MSPDLVDETMASLERALDRLPPSEEAPDRLEPALAEAQSRLPWPRIHTGLLDRVARFDTARDRLALVLHATDPDVAGAARGKGDMEAVFEVLVAAADARALDLFTQRARIVLDTLPASRGDLPSVVRLLEIVRQIEDAHETTADALVSLAQIVEDLEEAARAAEEADG